MWKQQMVHPIDYGRYTRALPLPKHAHAHAHNPAGAWFLLPGSQDTRVTLPPGAEEAADNEGCFFYLAGVNDYESDPQYEAALNGRDESVATVLLAHEPVQVRKDGEGDAGCTG